MHHCSLYEAIVNYPYLSLPLPSAYSAYSAVFFQQDLQRFLDAPEELLGESEEVQMAIAAFSETPRSLLQVLVNSEYSEVVEASRLHVNWVDEERGDYREAVSEVLRNKDLGENDRLAVELMKFAPVPPDLLSEWVPVNKLIQGLKNVLQKLAVHPKVYLVI
ncbi:MAG: hypothetical protein KI793_34650 [Rivularia sp. (in: Bacteria)]|nr:hypothetical protein [Rivularia sp. MS3]